MNNIKVAMNQIQPVLLIVFSIMLVQCSQPAKEEDKKDLKQYYSNSLHELYSIECEHLKGSERVISDTDIYKFRAMAFQEVLKDMDRKVLARYEQIYQELAVLEYSMSPDEKKEYQTVLRQVYSERCK